MFYANAIIYEYFILILLGLNCYLEPNKKMNIGDTEKSANIIKILMKQELMEKDSGRKHQEIENQMYMAQEKSKAMQISISTGSYLLMIAIEKIL